MSMNSYFARYKSPNIIIVPTVTSIPRIENISDTDKNNYLTVGEQIRAKDYVLPESQCHKLVINHENVPYSGGNIGGVDASNYFNNAPSIPDGIKCINTQQTITPSCSKYSSRKNLVDLTGFSHHSTKYISSSAESDGNLNYDKFYNYNKKSESIVIEEKQKYAPNSNIGFETKELLIPAYQPYNYTDTRPDNPSSENMCSSTKFEEIEATLKRFHNDEFRKDSEYKNLRKGIDKRQTGHDPNSSRNKYDDNINKREDNINQCRTEKTNNKSITHPLERNKVEHATCAEFEPKSSIKRISHYDNEDIAAKYSISKLSKTSDAKHSLERKFQRKKIELNFFEHETLSDTQKSNLSPGALKRYLAYQRFLRNYYNAEKIKEGKASKVKSSIQVIEKRIQRKAENCPMSTLKVTNKIEKTKEKPKAKTVNSFVNQTKKTEELRRKVNTVNQTKKKEELRGKVNSVIQTKKKEELRGKVNSVIQTKKKEELSRNITDVLDRKQKIKETKEKLRRILERKKNRETNEKVIASRDLKKNENSNKKQKPILDEKKKVESHKKLDNSVDLKKKKDSNENVIRHLELKKKESNEKVLRYLERKKDKEEAHGNLPNCLERKEKKEDSINKAKRYLELKTMKEESKLRRNKNSGHQEASEEKIPKVKSRSYNTVDTCSVERKPEVATPTVRTVDVSKKLNSSNFTDKCNDENDLRTLLTRKRSKNQCYTESKRRRTSQRENLFITVKQNINTKSEPAKVANKSKPKVKKSKKIKLVINIECPTSADSDDSDHTVNGSNSSPHPDLSFLDDIDIDGIVDSLNVDQSPTRKNNISSKGDFKDMTVCKNNLNCKREELISHNRQFKDLLESRMKQETLKEGCTDGASNDHGACQMGVSNNDQKNNTHLYENIILEGNQTNPTETQINVERMDDFNDEVCEVIDITDDINNQIIILEEDSVNLSDDDKAKENIEPLTESGMNLGETDIIFLAECDKTIQNIEEVVTIFEDGNSNDKTLTSNKVIDRNNLIQASIEPTKMITEEAINTKKTQDSSSVNNKLNTGKIDACTFVKLEAALAEITEKGLTNGPSDVSNKVKNSTSTNSNIQEQISVRSRQITKCSNVSPLKTNIETSKILENVNNVKDINPMQSNVKENLKHIEDIKSSIEIEKTNKKNDLIAKSEKTSGIQQSPVSDKVVTKPAEHSIDIIEIKSDVNKSATISSNEQTPNNLAVGNITANTTGNVVNNQNPKNIPISKNAQPVKINAASKTVQVKNVSNMKTVSNVVKNKESVSLISEKSKKNTESTEVNQVELGEEISINRNTPYIMNIEKRMFEYLNENFTITALIHQGYFSSVYKLTNTKGGTYAMKVLKHRFRNKAVFKDKMYSDLQKGITPNTSCILEIINTFNSSGEWCFLSEYYPKTLEQALLENGKGFHINVVQNLSRQLISAVTTLTNNQIIHTDIKPNHILLNSANGRLKLCGLDRSDYKDNIRIIPSSGTASYRAPETILGFEADYRIDVWATALVLYEMTTGFKLFPGQYNNDILYKQLCTLGPLNYDMLEQCSQLHQHFRGMKFMRQLTDKKWVYVEFHGLNNKFRHKLFASYNKDWRLNRTKKQAIADLEKLKMLYRLLEQMLVMDPRHRLPITFVGANEFIYNMFD